MAPATKGQTAEEWRKVNGIAAQGTPETFEELIKMHSDWANATFPKSTFKGAFIHAERELKEVLEYVDDTAHGEDTAIEIMDLLFCIMHGAEKMGITLHDLIQAGHYKLTVNMGREWIDNGDGSYRHKKASKVEPANVMYWDGNEDKANRLLGNRYGIDWRYISSDKKSIIIGGGIANADNIAAIGMYVINNTDGTFTIQDKNPLT